MFIDYERAMFEQEKLSQILDILGNKNRRRIIDLLQNKPCFVTEISEKLAINPKAVIEHLALMQKEDVISCYCDDKRRKYYFLQKKFDFALKVDPAAPEQNEQVMESAEVLPLSETISHLHTLMTTRRKMLSDLESIEKDIDRKMEELAANSYDVFKDDTEPEILLALIHSPLTPIELSDACGRPIPEITAALRTLTAKGYLESANGRYSLKDLSAPQQ